MTALCPSGRDGTGFAAGEQARARGVATRRGLEAHMWPGGRTLSARAHTSMQRRRGASRPTAGAQLHVERRPEAHLAMWACVHRQGRPRAEPCVARGEDLQASATRGRTHRKRRPRCRVARGVQNGLKSTRRSSQSQVIVRSSEGGGGIGVSRFKSRWCAQQCLTRAVWDQTRAQIDKALNSKDLRLRSAGHRALVAPRKDERFAWNILESKAPGMRRSVR